MITETDGTIEKITEDLITDLILSSYIFSSLALVIALLQKNIHMPKIINNAMPTKR